MQTTDPAVALDLEQLRNLTLEDPKLMRDILWALIEDTGRQAALLGDALRGGDTQKMIRLARSSARACANLGANRAAAAFRAIEHAAAAASDAAACQVALAALNSELDSLRSCGARL